MEGDVNAVESAAIPDKEICTEIVILLFVGRSQCVIILSRTRLYTSNEYYRWHTSCVQLFGVRKFNHVTSSFFYNFIWFHIYFFNPFNHVVNYYIIFGICFKYVHIISLITFSAYIYTIYFFITQVYTLYYYSLIIAILPLSLNKLNSDQTMKIILSSYNTLFRLQ